MDKRVVKQAQDEPTATIVRQLLDQHPPIQAPSANSEALARRVAILERQGPELVHAAEEAKVGIEVLGIAPLPPGPMYYEGSDGTGWVMGPATKPEDAVVPRSEGEQLHAIQDAGIYFPRIYVAHEVQEHHAERLRGQVPAGGLEVEPAHAVELAGPIPDPAVAVERGERMAEYSDQVVAAMRRTGKLIVGAVTVPVQAAATVLAETAATVDPVVLAVIPAASEHPGQPAMWLRLVAWEW